MAIHNQIKLISMNITFNDLSESQSLSLLAEVIKCQQCDLDKSSSEKLRIEQELEKVKSTLESFGGKEREYKEQIAQLEKSCNDCRESNKKLTAENKELSTKVNKISEEITEGTTIKEQLASEKRALEAEVEFAKLFCYENLLSVISSILSDVHEQVTDEAWRTFIHGIANEIDEAINQKSKLNDAIFNALRKNGWLTKLASLYWWCEEGHVSDKVPMQISKSIALHNSFDALVRFFNSCGKNITLPNKDFSDSIEKYQIDHQSQPIFRTLFPGFEMPADSEFILCEISFLAINGGDGKCAGLRKEE